MKPKNFCIYPWSSVAKKSEAEVVARNIMSILARTGNEFRKLSYEEYESERLKDGNYSEMEKEYFEQVIDFCKNEDTARLFSKTWKNV